MKSLSQSEYGELRSLYQQVYASPEVEITEELIDEIFDELLDELVEEGYEQEEAIEILDEAIDDYLAEGYYDSAVSGSKKNAAALDRAARQKRRAGQARYYKRKAGEALSSAKKKVAGAAAGAAIAGSIAKDEVRRAGRKAAHSASKAASAVKSAPGKAKEKAKSGIKGFIKRQAEKVVKRMSEEVEALQATGKFTEAEIAAFASVEEGYKEIDAKKHGRMYDRYKKLRTAAMKDAAETGEASGDNRYKMGKMQGVISKSAENLRKKG